MRHILAESVESSLKEVDLKIDNPMYDVLTAFRKGVSPQSLAQMLLPFYNPTASASTDAMVCVQALVASGLDLGSPESFPASIDDNSVLMFTQTGEFVGLDQIQEYVNFVAAGDFITSFSAIGVPSTPLFNFYGSTAENCVVTLLEARRLTVNPNYTGGKTTCLDAPLGAFMQFTPKITNGAVSGMTVKKYYAYLPEDLISEAFDLFDTDATAEYVCNVLEINCADNMMFKDRDLRDMSNIEELRNLKRRKQNSCLKRFEKLPAYEGKLNYIDGNSKGCRMLHAELAKANDMHCPHVTFEKEPDTNGKVKCSKSKKNQYHDLFQDWQLDFFRLAAIALYGLDPDSLLRISASC